MHDIIDLACAHFLLSNVDPTQVGHLQFFTRITCDDDYLFVLLIHDTSGSTIHEVADQLSSELNIYIHL